MPSDEKRPTEEHEPPPLTKEEFEAQMKELTERARAAGLNPIHTMAHTYAKQGMAILEGLLTSLEDANSKNRKKD